MLADVADVLALEIRQAGLVSDPKPLLGWPWDSNAEQDVLSALLSGHVTTADLEPLRAEHFFATLFQSIFAVIQAGAPATDLPAVAAAMAERGPVVDELEQIRDTTPFATPKRLELAVHSIVECWQARQLLHVLGRLDVQLRLRQVNHAGARAILREYFVGAPGVAPPKVNHGGQERSG